jgi:chromosomal replication initiator protein
LDDEIVDIIAKKVKKNIREIEGILQKIDFYKDKRADLSKRAVEELIDRSIQSIAKPVTDLQVLAAVAEFYQIKVEDLTGRCRKKEVVEPRQVAMYLLRDILGLSYPYIGDKMGRDHTTAIHSYEKINEEVNKNPGLNQKIFQIKEVISKS